MISLAYAMVALVWLAILFTFKGEIAARPHHLASACVGDAHQGEIGAGAGAVKSRMIPIMILIMVIDYSRQRFIRL